MMRIGMAMILMWIVGCTDQKQSGVQDFPNTLEASAQSVLYELPTSIAYASPSVDGESIPLAKLVDSLQSDRESAFAPYLAVPQFIDISEAAKASVRSFLVEYAKLDLPPEWEGMTDSLYAKTSTNDTLIAGVSYRQYTLRASKDGVIRFALQFIKSNQDRFKGVFYMKEPSAANATIRVEFDQISDTLAQSLLVEYVRDVASLDKLTDPTYIRVRSRYNISGKLVVGGYSYHPAFKDEFWGEGPKVYGFRAVSVAKENRTLLKVAFADAEKTSELNEKFFAENALDKRILTQASEPFRKLMADSVAMHKLVYYSLENELSVTEALQGDHLIALVSYIPTRSPEKLTDVEFVQFLELNRTEILSGTSKLGELRTMYYMVHIHQPLFLAESARVIGAGVLSVADGLPEFPITLDELNDLQFNTDTLVTEIPDATEAF